MHLKSLELTGFKSFAKKTTLNFSSPITAIVGPNGSGKSNVAEAFRFVLGEQSIKSMRGKKGEDLIFNGGADAPRANRAGVKIILDNTKRLLDVDFDEVALERVVHRDGINEYLINGSVVRLRDIIELLAQAHIGSSGHHIISQGEADRILNSNIKERRGMIEDALGLKIYQYKRQESERKLEKTAENIREVGLLRKEIAPHLKFLEKQVEKVEKAREMKNKLTELYREYFKRESEFINYHKDQVKREKQIPEERLKKLVLELEKAKETLSQSKSQDEKSRQLIKLEEGIRALQNNKSELTRELGRLEGEIASVKRLTEVAEKNSSRQSGIPLDEAEELNDEIGLRLERAQTISDLGSLRGLFSEVKDLLDKLISRYKVGNQEQDNNLLSESDSKSLQTKLQDVEMALPKIEKEEEGLKNSYDKLQKEIEAEKDSSRDAEKMIFKIMAEQNDVNLKLDRLNDEEKNLKHQEENFKRDLAEGAALVGIASLDFKKSNLNIAEIIDEKRGRQEERRHEIEKIKIRLEDSGAASGEDIVKEYQETSERDKFLARELEDLEKSADSLRELIADLEERLNNEFKEGVEKINKQFQDFFVLMFGGGEASLQVIRRAKRKRSDTDVLALEDESALAEAMEADEEEGIEITVSLPRKKIKGLEMLSGGERSLTSIALIFAMSQVNPPPFIVLDETDAALDESNSRKYGDMIENLAKESQLILITHNRETMSRSGVLYGVTMGSGGVSKLLSIAFEEATAVAK